jgi:hypothetical protein
MVPLIPALEESMRLLGLLLLLPLLSNCMVADAPSHDEVARYASPDGGTDAIVIESNGGATTSFWYDVCLSPHTGTCTARDSIASLYGAARSEQAYGVNVRWIDSTNLAIDFLSAERSSIRRPISHLNGRSIKVVLHPGITDPAAPPGGMLYNKQGRPQDKL